MKILVAEDDRTSALFLKNLLGKRGHEVAVAYDGKEAEEALAASKFDLLVTDWMMPKVDGLELIHRARNKKLVPLTVMVTQLSSPRAKSRALDSGADGYVTKPIDPKVLFGAIEDCVQRHQQPTPEATSQALVDTKTSGETPPFVGVVIASSTGGPDALRRFFKELPDVQEAAFFIVQHGPAWLMEAFVSQLQEETNLVVTLARDGEEIRAGHIYIAPGDKHLMVNDDFSLELTNEPRENFCRPSADPLFRSAAHAFGEHSIALVLTGMGKDGCVGAVNVAAVGGRVIVQDPETAVAPSMPSAVKGSVAFCNVVVPEKIPTTVSSNILRISNKLNALV